MLNRKETIKMREILKNLRFLRDHMSKGVKRDHLNYQIVLITELFGDLDPLIK